MSLEIKIEEWQTSACVRVCVCVSLCVCEAASASSTGSTDL